MTSPLLHSTSSSRMVTSIMVDGSPTTNFIKRGMCFSFILFYKLFLKKCIDRNNWFCENGSFSVCFFTEHYPSILMYTGRWGNRFQKTQGTSMYNVHYTYKLIICHIVLYIIFVFQYSNLILLHSFIPLRLAIFSRW